MTKKSLIGDLMARPETTTEKEKPRKKRSKSKSFTFTLNNDTIQRFNKIQWLLEFHVEQKRFTRNDVLEKALDLLSDEIDYDELMKEYGEKMPEDISPRVGR